MPDYDLAVIGAGPGGYVAAVRAGALGLKTALVNEGELGGTCLNVGCIPTKAMLHTAEILHAASAGEALGLPALRGDLGAFAGAALKWRQSVVETLRKGVAALLKARGVEVIEGRGRLSGERTVTVTSGGGEKTMSAQSVIVATGSEPVVPAALGPVSERVMTSAEALALEEAPASVVVIGGGYIGCEFASYYLDLGAKVTVIEMLPEIVRGLETELRKELERSMKRRKAKIHCNTKVAAVKPGKKDVTVELEGREAVKAERVLLAVGRRPRTESFGLGELGIAMDGPFVTVDGHGRTSAPWLYAVGDITPGPMLAHRASHQGILAAETVAGLDRPGFTGPIPACVFTRPEISTVGLTEAEAREAGREIKTGTFQMRALGRAHASGETSGLVKIVADAATEQILGVHIAGERATDLIAEAALAVRLEATLEELAGTIHAHPTFAEALMEAAAAARGEGIHSL